MLKILDLDHLVTLEVTSMQRKPTGLDPRVRKVKRVTTEKADLKETKDSQAFKE